MTDCMCPNCESMAFKRNGFTRHGKQNLRCLDCGRQFSVEPFNGVAAPQEESSAAQPHKHESSSEVSALVKA